MITRTAPDAGSGPGMQHQMQALLALVQAEHQRRLDALTDQTQSRAAEVHRQAHAAARARMRQAFAEQRQRHQATLSAATAELATQRRLHQQQHTAALLQRAWQRLPAELMALWQHPAARAAWVGQALASAGQLLPRGAWRVVHPADWPADEQQALAEAVLHGAGKAPQLQADETLRAGLKLVSGGNVIDATLPGLLADRAECESRLLHELEAAA